MSGRPAAGGGGKGHSPLWAAVLFLAINSRS
jgi:hypothetical protein